MANYLSVAVGRPEVAPGPLRHNNKRNAAVAAAALSAVVLLVWSHSLGTHGRSHLLAVPSHAVSTTKVSLPPHVRPRPSGPALKRFAPAATASRDTTERVPRHADSKPPPGPLTAPELGAMTAPAAATVAAAALASLVVGLASYALGRRCVRQPDVALLTVSGAMDEFPSPSTDPEDVENVMIPTYLNKTPHSREVRQYFYEDALLSLLSALEAGETRMKLQSLIPELTTDSDVYRVGTMLELVRYMATELAMQGKRVKICVQNSMGEGIFQGLPLALAGMMRLAQKMDWDEDAVGDRIVFGAVGADEVEEEDDVYLLISPQNITGHTIMGLLQEMCDAAGDRPIVLINPNLTDIPSANGVMTPRGRQERLDFAASFYPIYHFRLLYRRPYFYPIYGALRRAYGGPWSVYKRLSDGPQSTWEEYKFSRKFETEPNADKITKAIRRNVPR